MHETRITYDWHGHTIDFSAWPYDAYGVYEYTSRDGYHFTFDLQPVGYQVLIYILKQPSYCGQPDGGHETHRLGLPDNPYVCVKGELAPTNVPDALSWMVYWAEETATYIRTGYAFS